MNKFGEKLKEKRAQLKLTQSALAEMLNISDRTVSKWETGNGYPDITMLKSISVCLNTSISELMDSENESGINATQQNSSIDTFEIKIRNMKITSIFLLLTAVLYILLPLLRINMPDGAIGEAVQDSNIYIVTSIILTTIISLCYLFSISLFSYIIVQYSSEKKIRHKNYIRRITIKKYVTVYLILSATMVAFVITALNINL